MRCQICHWDCRGIPSEKGENMNRVNAIVLAAGSGRRMGSEKPKQYMELCEKPLMVYALERFAQSSVDGIVLVVASGEVEYCRNEIIKKYGIKKVTAIVEGGCERYDSVYRGLQVAESEYVLVHDAARAFVSTEVIERAIEGAFKYQACVMGVPAKDTIKIANEEGFVSKTPERNVVWAIQTPQSFSYPLLKEAYEKMMLTKAQAGITDDAMVVERMLNVPVKILMGDYTNIKITTPDDMLLGEKILSNIS